MNIRSFTPLLLAILCGCGGGTIEDVDPDSLPAAPSWNEDVRPMLDRYCQGCHSDQTVGGAPDGYDLDSYELVVCEWDKIGNVTVDERSMPPGGAQRPDARELAILERWAAQGFALEEGTPAPLPTDCDVFDDRDKDEDEDKED